MPTLPCLNESHQKKDPTPFFTAPRHALCGTHFPIRLQSRSKVPKEMHNARLHLIGSELSQVDAHEDNSGAKEALACGDALGSGRPSDRSGGIYCRSL